MKLSTRFYGYARIFIEDKGLDTLKIVKKVQDDMIKECAEVV